MKKLVLAILIALISVLSYNTFQKSRMHPERKGERLELPFDTVAAVCLQRAVGIPSISYDDTLQTEFSGIDSLIGFLRNQFPKSFASLSAETVNGHSLLLTWKGKSGKKRPVILYAHMDVVPVENNGTASWRFEPFSDQLKDDTIRGRGTVDDKLGVIGLLEATERLLTKGFNPAGDIYFAFGHDEESGGQHGAARIAQLLESRGVRAEWMLDEGGMVAEGIVPFVDKPVALVMVAEKGYMSVELSVESNGGHSSFPPAESPIDILSSAVVRVKDSPLERKITQPLDEFMDYVGPSMRFPFNLVFANRWLFSPVILNEYEKIPEGNATIRTTVAWTMSAAGIKENVLPARATITANLRILPGSSVKSTLAELTAVVNDPRVQLRVLPGAMEPVSASSSTSEGFKAIEAAIARSFPDAVVAPTLSIASTDSRHFGKVTEARYRFLPVRMNRDILSGMHGKNERLAVRDFMETIEFYQALLSSR